MSTVRGRERWGAYCAAVLFSLAAFAAEAQNLLIDFGTAATPLQAGYQAYQAGHEVAADFNTKSFAAFGTTINVTPSWPGGTLNTVMQMIDRAGDDGMEQEDLFRDWIGSDNRVDLGDLTITLAGLPAGNYVWKSYHHDPADQTGPFDVTVTDSTGATVTTGLDISNGANFLTADTSQFESLIVSNGGDVTLTFASTGTTNSTLFFVLNAFEISEQTANSTPVVTTFSALPIPVDIGTTLAGVRVGRVSDLETANDNLTVDVVSSDAALTVSNVSVNAANGDVTADLTAAGDAEAGDVTLTISATDNDGTPATGSAVQAAKISPAGLRVDFGRPAGDLQPGFQAYVANHEVLEEFTPQNFTAFGGTVTVTPTWITGAVNTAMQSILRGGTSDTNSLLVDWIGTDNRDASGPGDPLTLTISGVPEGRYRWTSYHHDTDNQTGIFNATVADANGTNAFNGVDISDFAGDGVSEIANVTKIEAVLVSNGGNIVWTFDHQSIAADAVQLQFFALNGFELVEIPPLPPGTDITSNVYPPYIDEDTMVILTAPQGTGYQWYLDGIPITGANDATLVFNSVSVADEGFYSVLYNNGTEDVETPPFLLSVNQAGTVPAAGLIGLATLGLGLGALGIRARKRK